MWLSIVSMRYESKAEYILLRLRTGHAALGLTMAVYKNLIFIYMFIFRISVDCFLNTGTSRTLALLNVTS